MRFLIASRIYRPEPSAASLFLGSVSDALTEAGHTVDVLTARPPKYDLARSAGRKNEHVRTFPALRDRNGYVRGYMQYLSFDLPLALRLLFAKRPEAVLVEPPPTTGAVVRVVCALRRIPYVYDAADIWSDAAGHATRFGFVVDLLRSVEQFTMRGAAHIVTVSQGVVERLDALGIRRPVTVTGFGADTNAFHYVDNASIKSEFIYAGTYTELHGAEILIDAFAAFLATRPGHRLRFIGNSTNQDGMERRAEQLGVASSVSFEPLMPAAALREELSHAQATLATLHPDGGYDYAFTTKIYSSLAVGCPVLFAGPGPTRSFLETAPPRVRAGVATPYQAEDIAEAMRDFVDHPLSHEQRRELAAWTASEHSMITVAHRVERVLTRVAERRGRG